jgi:transketolase
MRNAFIKSLYDVFEKNENAYFFTGDLGYGVLDKIAEDFPERFVNAGICEQNMTSVAAGLALSGCTVYTYSIASFSTLRCLEQIRDNAAYHNADVKIISVGAGVGYGTLGMTHQATEDLSVMRAIPNMTIISPCDPEEAAVSAEISYKKKGTVYIRLGKGGEKNLSELSPEADKITVDNYHKHAK